MKYSKSKDFKLLRILVYTMGIVLIGGAIFLTSVIYKRSQGNLKAVSTNCVGGNIDLSLSGEVEQAKHENGKIILVTRRSRGKQDVVVLDYCSNKVISRTSISISGNEEKDYTEVEQSFNTYTG